MAIIKWLHFSDLHLNSDEMETELLREELPKFLLKSGIRCDYAFCTGDIRFAPAGEFPDNSADYIKNLCSSVHVPMENLFIVPGNHDVNIYSEGRSDAVTNVISQYNSRVGKIDLTNLAAMHAGQKDFRNLLAEVFADVPDRLSYYKDPMKPHFVIQTEFFNILHVDTTLVYDKGHEANLIVGTKPLYDAIKTLNTSKPTILITHYAMASLSQDERKSLAQLLQKNNIKLWLAGHEHDHNLMPYSYIYSIQAGELRYEDRANATVLVGEYDTETSSGSIKAYTWFQEGWAEYPIIWHGYVEENKFPFVLGLPADKPEASREARICKRINSQHFQYEVIPELFPNLQYSNFSYLNNGTNPLEYLLDELWKAKKNVVLLADGGMGKTTLMLDVAKQKENQPILFISLEQLEAYNLSIEQFICRSLFGSDHSGDKLYEFTNSSKTRPDLILLLDGFNEIGAKAAQKFAKEMKGLSLYPGMQIVVTSREDFTQRYKIPFLVANLLELSDEQILGILSEEELQQIKGTYTLQKLLRNPMLLLMYKQVCPIMKKHQDAFLDWCDTVENATQLFHNYFLAQMAVLLERAELDGERLLVAYKCIGYALPYIGYCLEKEHRLSIPADDFERTIDEAANIANRCSFLDDQLRKVQRKYRVRDIPHISPFDIDDFLVKEMHLLHEEGTLFSFSHQIYRDYLSANWIVNATNSESIDAIWNQRKFPYYLLNYIGPMSGQYWNGLAKQIADCTKGRDKDEIREQIYNLIHAFPYTQDSGVPDYSGLDLRNIRLPDYPSISGRILMRDARISKISLALFDQTPSIYRCLEFSADDEWLAGTANGTVHIWSMLTGRHHSAAGNGHKLSTFYFSQDQHYLFSVPLNQFNNIIDVYINDGESWTYGCRICDAINNRIRFMILVGEELRIYYNNRERRYNLTDGSMTYNRQKQHAWENPAAGEILPERLINHHNNKMIKNAPDGLCYQAVSHSGEFRACSYNDGTLIVQRNGEMYAVLARGVTRLKAAAISGNGKRAVTLSQGIIHGCRKMQIWNLETKTRCGERLCDEKTKNIHMSETGEWIIGEMAGAYWIWNWSDEEKQYSISGILISNQHGKLTSYGNKVLYKNRNNLLELFDLDTREFSKVKNIRKNSRIAAFMPDGNLIVVGNNANKAVFHSIRDGQELSINSEKDAVTGIFCMKRQPFVALATSNQKVSIYHTGTGRRTRILTPSSGNKIIVGHPSKDAIACSSGNDTFEIFNYFSFKTRDGIDAGRWYENVIDTKLYGNVLDMDFNEMNGELVVIMSDGTIIYSHELYCKYHCSTKIITSFSVDAYDFTDVICDNEIKADLKNNGAVI